MTDGNWQHIERKLEETTGRAIRFENIQSVGGGCINQAHKAHDQNGKQWFIKSNRASLSHMFEAEFLGLQELNKANAIRIPKPYLHTTVGQNCYLVMEYIDMRGQGQPCLAGEQLAQMHHCVANQFGWAIDNTIGSTHQPNTHHNDWISFWRTERLEFQLDLALKNQLSSDSYDKGMVLSEKLPLFFSNYQPKASLLHGDLWGGNIVYDERNQPVIFDPAVYYGDHEADLAMTELFGGFGRGFYDCYNEHYPIDSGYSARKTLYNLYHILNHFNLFGGGYGSQVDRMIEQLLSEVG